MAYTVNELLEDVIHRVGRKVLAEHGELFLLRGANGMYEYLNRKYKIVERDAQVDFDLDRTPSTALYVALPADFLELQWIEPYKVYRVPTVFSFTEARSFTIRDNKIYIPDAFTGTLTRYYFGDGVAFALTPVLATDTIFDLAYYSAGKTLVRTVLTAATETNEPEWPEDLKRLMLYAVALELGGSYPQRPRDQERYDQLVRELKIAAIHKQSASPNLIGPMFRRTNRDDPYGDEAQFNPEFV